MARTTETVLITGATDGIGRELARCHRDRGDRLLLVGRRSPDELDQTLFGPDRYLTVDLAEPDAIQRIRNGLAERGVDRIDRVYFNAGTGSFGAVEAETRASIDSILDVNLRSAILATRCLFSHFAPHARLVYVTSVAAHLPARDYAVYAASKAALNSFARELRAECTYLRPSHPSITIARPGATRTGLHAKIGLPTERRSDRWPSASVVAAAIVRGADHRRRFVTPGVGPKFMMALERLAPRLVDRIARGRRQQSAARRSELWREPCVVTGFADGIGRALALEFAERGYPIIGIDRDALRGSGVVGEVRRLGVPAWNVTADLSTVDGLAAVTRALRGVHPSIVVHNAGINAFGPFDESVRDELERVLAVNLWAPLQLTRELLHRRVVTKSTRTVFVASLSHQIGYPGAAVYAATKSGLASFARSLDAAGHQTLTVFPGPTRTAHARRYAPDNSREERRMDPRVLASRIAQAAHREDRRLIPGRTNRLLAGLGALAPNLTRRLLAGALLTRDEESSIEARARE